MLYIHIYIYVSFVLPGNESMLFVSLSSLAKSLECRFNPLELIYACIVDANMQLQGRRHALRRGVISLSKNICYRT